MLRECPRHLAIDPHTHLGLEDLFPIGADELHAAQAGSTQLPQVDLGLGAQRQQISPAAQGLPGDTREFSLYSASVGVRYRFDFGGGIGSGLAVVLQRDRARVRGPYKQN